MWGSQSSSPRGEKEHVVAGQTPAEHTIRPLVELAVKC